MTARPAMAGGRPGLIFHWPERTYLSFTLAGSILLSALAHALCFFLFQVAYPPSSPPASPPAQVYVLSPSNEGHKALLRWIDAQDPSLISRPHDVIPASVFELRYSPSYAEVHAQPKPAPAETPSKTAFPPAQDILSVVQSALPRNSSANQAELPGRPTELHFSAPLAARTAVSGLPLSIEEKSQASLQPSSFLIGVSGEGKIQFIFLRSQSGNKKMDAAAEAALGKVQFAPDSSEITWSTATIYWGVDAYPARAAAK